MAQNRWRFAAITLMCQQYRLIAICRKFWWIQSVLRCWWRRWCRLIGFWNAKWKKQTNCELLFMNWIRRTLLSSFDEWICNAQKLNAWRRSESAMHRITYTRWPAFCVRMSRPKTTMALSFIVIYCRTHAALSRLMNREHQGKGWNGILFFLFSLCFNSFVRKWVFLQLFIVQEQELKRTY